MIDFNRHIEIENYLSGNMTDQDKYAFEIKLQSDVNLKNELLLQQAANKLIKQNQLNLLKSKLKNIHAEQVKQKKRKKIIVATSIFVGILLIIGVYLNNKNDADKVKNLNENLNINSDSIIFKDSQLPINSEENIFIESDENSTDNKVVKNYNLPIKQKAETNKNNTSINKDSNKVEVKIVDKVSLTPKAIQLSENKRKSNILETLKNDSVAFITNQSDIETRPYDCDKISKIKPPYKMSKKPCFGDENGLLELLEGDSVKFIEYSINNGQFTSLPDKIPVTAQEIEIVAMDENQCLSQSVKVKINYGSCNYIIRPLYSKYLELNLNGLNEPVKFEVLHGRYGNMVYQEVIEFPGKFIYEGIDNSQNQLDIGNYIYTFTTISGELISKGQITVIR